MEIKNWWPKGNDIDPDKLKESEEMFNQLMRTALEGKQSEFSFITNWTTRNMVKQYLTGASAVVEMFYNLEQTTLKAYIEQVKINEQDLGAILALKQLHQCRKFYEGEVALAHDMLDEYKAYIWGGHIWDTLVGNNRKEEDMVDYRTLPVKWF